MENTIQVPVHDLRACCASALSLVGVPEEHIQMTLQVLITAELQGLGTHGTRRLIPYILRMRDGLINPQPSLRIEKKTPAASLVEGDNGLGPVVAMAGLNEALELSGNTGVAFVGCRNSNHFGPAAPYALEACRREMIVLLGTNGFPTMPAWGGRESMLGINPIAIGVPRRDAPPFILDMSMSMSSRGRIRKAAENGQEIPSGWALNPEGRPTTDPVEALKGFVCPIGGHKGYGLALAVDLIAGVLTGSAFGTDVLSLFQQWEKPQRIGHFFICIDPSRLMDLDRFYERVDSLLDAVKSSAPLDPLKPVLIPGEPEAESYGRLTETGIPLKRDIWEALQDLSRGIYTAKVPER